MSKSIAIVATSTRTPRVGPHVAALVKSLLDEPAKAGNITLAPVDLAEFKLPVYDEAVVPGMINPAQPDGPRYSNAPSIAWSNEIKRHDGYVLVIPEYNYGLSGATKNAIDYLMHEWKGKPVGIVSYGILGGAFASEQAAHVLGKMGLKVAETKPQLQFKGAQGPDLMSAMLKGELGEESAETWRKDKGEEIVKVFEEVRVLLD
ncbi:flavoprotein-like protein [Podospora aff. communis PSN243]|uniref:Flavoprotein-like protein n=1 Tax=Podospora aff. communis PSN243 TaxID=3040156 RepID=A0AAV9GAF5_9PEZI|nr:flavoprotein-like protein [Podospora aff. communis PSN243]